MYLSTVCSQNLYKSAGSYIQLSKCVDLFLLDQCVINVVYVCLSCLKVIGQYATKPTKTVFRQWNTKNPNQPNQPKTVGPNRTRPWLLRSASSTT